MNNTNTLTHLTHLTDDQIDDALIGDLAADSASHLAGCDECRIRLAEAGAPIASFNAVSLAWSERRSATLPTRPARAAHAWLPRAAWAATAAVVVAVGVAVPLQRHSAENKAVAGAEGSGPTLMASTGPVENPVAARAEQIARDNQMLENIDRELDTPAESPDREYGLSAIKSSNHSTHVAPASVRN